MSVDVLDGGSDQGLSSQQARERLSSHGRNAVSSPGARPLYQRIFAQFQGALSLLLLAAALLDLLLWSAHGRSGAPLEPLAILGVLALNAALGVLQEYRSEQALGALRALGQPFAWVLRDGAFERLPADEIVQDDLLRLEAGDRIPADGAILRQASLGVDESILTGESIPCDKSAGDSVASGTLVVRGGALVRVTATGAESAMGRLAQQLSNIQTTRTPLERRVETFGRKIAWTAVALVACIVLLGVASEGVDRLNEVVSFAVAFAIAIVPEGMPAMLTLTLALGVERMARRRAVVRRLAAVEALGSVTVVATDKTGTLTENRVRVARIFARNEQALIEAAVLANDADLGGKLGDPLDLALLSYATDRGVDVGALRASNPRVSSRPFDASWRYARVTVDGPDGRTSYLKGAFEVLLGMSQVATEEGDRLHAFHDEQTRRGCRVIAVGRCQGEGENAIELLGLVATWDPPRALVEEAIATVRSAGVRVIMITGDHPATAGAIAEQVGLASPRVITGDELRGLKPEEQTLAIASADVIARATAEDKLMIVEALQEKGEIVAMTGDGVNDAPALKRADIGVAMGQRGSDVAREVSDLVLLDDDFSTIARALDEGRNIYDNIQKFVRFTFATNVALAILILGGAVGSFVLALRDSAGSLILPLSAIQLLFINFVGDGPPALALATDRNSSVMRRRPRPAASPLLDGPALKFICYVGLLQGSIGLALLLVLPLLGYAVASIQTLVFFYESIAKVVSVYPARRASGAPAPNGAVHVAVASGALLTLACLFVPALRSLLGLAAVPLSGLFGVALCVLATWGLAEWLVYSRIRRG